MTAFQRKVARIVRGIPRGTTLSYGEVALRAGKPGGARAVVAALHTLGDIPWWRVARWDGTLAPQVARLQATLLRQEGWNGRKSKISPRRREGREGF
ncbi:MAG: MGMT family protein [Myxococcales bacterium]|nr:MGMT family protein [Myxococcales bacterium]